MEPSSRRSEKPYSFLPKSTRSNFRGACEKVLQEGHSNRILGFSDLWGPPTTYQHHKDFRSKRGIFRGVVYELSEPKRTAKYTPTPPSRLHWRCSSLFLVGGVRGLWALTLVHSDRAIQSCDRDVILMAA